MRFLLLLLVAASAVVRREASANLGGVPGERLKMQYAMGPLLKFQICLVQTLDNEVKLNVHMDSIPHHRS
ncbi:hypothetical protein J1605_006993 [Eschrichtius robustus]|uniref:Uncharacterized protein n=1 Tax=Eschrichtius robustus TaxID=9764 RepID=A0AB34GY09_ESCRO|nr:hypothetical protein J1605_006993 [Eschrichtius robustus]